MKKSIIIFLLFSFKNLYSQLSPKVNALTEQLSRNNTVESKFVNYEGSESNIFKLYDSISKIATKKEVEYLAFHGSTTVKAYFSNNLVIDKSNKLKKLFINFIQQNDSLYIKVGCVGNKTLLAGELYQQVYNLPHALKEKEEFKQILREKKFENDDYLLNELKEVSNSYPHWDIKSAKKMILAFDKIAINPKNKYVNIVEFICLINKYNTRKLPYYKDLYYFKEKYKSKIITDYINYCEKQ